MKTSIRRVWKSQVQKFRLYWKFSAFFSLLSFLAVLFAPTYSIFANPPVPMSLLGEDFHPQILEESFREAGALHDVQSWNEFMQGRFGLFRASWEVGLDTQINEYTKKGIIK